MQEATKQNNFDTDVLEPLRAAQELQRQKEADRQAEALRAAEDQRQADLSATANRIAPAWTYGNSYAWGQCTALVASEIHVPEYLGNATNWSWGLLSAGWRTGPPRVGAIGVSHVGFAGHVVVIKAVDGDNVLVEEANWIGVGEVDQRWTWAGDFEYFF